MLRGIPGLQPSRRLNQNFVANLTRILHTQHRKATFDGRRHSIGLIGHEKSTAYEQFMIVYR